MPRQWGSLVGHRCCHSQYDNSLTIGEMQRLSTASRATWMSNKAVARSCRLLAAIPTVDAGAGGAEQHDLEHFCAYSAFHARRTGRHAGSG